MRHGRDLRRHQAELGNRRRLRPDRGARHRRRRSDALRRRSATSMPSANARSIAGTCTVWSRRCGSRRRCWPITSRAGIRSAAYHGSKVATKLKVMGVEVASMGIAEPRDARRRSGAVLRAEARHLQEADHSRRPAGRRHSAGRHQQGRLSDAGLRPQHAAARRAPAAAVRYRRSAEAGDVRGDARRHAGLQLQRRQQGRDRRLRERGQAQRQGGDGRDARRHGLRLVQGDGVRNRGVGLRRRGGRRSFGALLRARRAADQAGADPRHSRAQSEIRLGRFRRSGRRQGRRGQQARPGVAAEDDLERRVRRRARRALHQRSRPRQHPERRNILRRAADSRRHHQSRRSCGASPTWRTNITCRWSS